MITTSLRVNAVVKTKKTIVIRSIDHNILSLDLKVLEDQQKSKGTLLESEQAAQTAVD